MLNEKYEEILEAAWRANEDGKDTIAVIQEGCIVDFDTDDLAEMDRQGLLTSNGSKITLTEDGRAHAKMIIRRHRLAEVLVRSILKLRNEEMEEVACKMEHSLIPEVEQSICTLLGHPQFCPDGNPIPPGKCCSDKGVNLSKTVVALSDLGVGESGNISYIMPGSHSNMHQLMSMGLHAGVNIKLHATSPAYCMQFDNTEIAVDKELAEQIFVWKIES